MINQASMGGGGPGSGAGGDQPQHDNAEMIYISSLALLKVRRIVASSCRSVLLM